MWEMEEEKENVHKTETFLCHQSFPGKRMNSYTKDNGWDFIHLLSTYQCSVAWPQKTATSGLEKEPEGWVMSQSQASLA